MSSSRGARNRWLFTNTRAPSRSANRCRWAARERCSSASCAPFLELGERAEQLFDADGLHEVRVEAGPRRAIAILRLAPSRQRDEQDVLSPGLLADPMRGRIPVEVRHPEIEQHDLRFEGRRNVERF